MTTHVPVGTPEQAIDDVRTREALRAGELASQGHLLRLWRPPLRQGEWRTLGLCAAADAVELEQVLASMPLRIWRTDDVTALSPHGNDPAATGQGHPAVGAEYLITMTIRPPAGAAPDTVAATMAREAERAGELAGRGNLLRLWALPQRADQPGERRTLGLWSATDTAEMTEVLRSLPLYPWMTIEVTPLSAHPSDPGGARG